MADAAALDRPVRAASEPPPIERFELLEALAWDSITWRWRASLFSGGFDKTTSKRISGTGTQVVRVALVDAVVGFDVTPDVLEVARGTHVVLKVVNEGGEDHDLAVDGGAKTRTLGPGQSERLDLGTVAGDWAGWCTLPGHKVAGMTLDIEVLDIEVVDPSATKRSEQEATS